METKTQTSANVDSISNVGVTEGVAELEAADPSPVVAASPPVGEVAEAPKGKIKLKATKFDVHNSQSKTVYRQNEVVEVDAIGNFEKAQIAAGYLVQL